ncbi:MAG: hypothetical protein RIQ72_445 [Candidatus Parcubacteria bacterium]|jgi:hypothetical protein
MPKDYVTTTKFNLEMKVLNRKISDLDKKIDSSIDALRTELKAHAEEQRQIFEKNCRGYLELFLEQMNHKFIVLMEHPVFSEYEAAANKRLIKTK